jgi:hypothetical protein
MSLGAVWQSVDRHQVSLPLVIVNDCVVVPTLNVQAAELSFFSLMESFGFCPAAYEVLSATAWTVMSPAEHAFAAAVAPGLGESLAVGVGVGVGFFVGVRVGLEVADVDVDTEGSAVVASEVFVEVAAGSSARPCHGWAMSSQTTAITARMARSSTRRRRRYTAGECRRRGVVLLTQQG